MVELRQQSSPKNEIAEGQESENRLFVRKIARADTQNKRKASEPPTAKPK
jgi:hypothetical protein